VAQWLTLTQAQGPDRRTDPIVGPYWPSEPRQLLIVDDPVKPVMTQWHYWWPGDHWTHWPDGPSPIDGVTNDPMTVNYWRPGQTVTDGLTDQFGQTHYWYWTQLLVIEGRPIDPAQANWLVLTHWPGLLTQLVLLLLLLWYWSWLARQTQLVIVSCWYCGPNCGQYWCDPQLTQLTQLLLIIVMTQLILNPIIIEWPNWRTQLLLVLVTDYC